MTVDDFLSRLDGVRPTARGHVALCPAHADRNPSLSVAEGDDGRILIRDFAGCTAKEILVVMGLTFADLWPDRALRPRHKRPIQKRWRFDWRRTSRDVLHHADTLFLRTESVLAVAQHLHINTWTERELHAALGVVAQAYEDRKRAALLWDVAVSLRVRGLALEREACA